MQISKFGINFNYKMEKWRAFLYLMVPILLIFILQTIDFLLFQFDWKHPLHILWIGPNSLRFIVCVLAPMAFVIFIRSLYIRFETLNSLLRFVSFMLVTALHKTLNDWFHFIGHKSFHSICFSIHIGIGFWQAADWKFQLKFIPNSRLMLSNLWDGNMRFWLTSLISWMCATRFRFNIQTIWLYDWMNLNCCYFLGRYWPVRLQPSCMLS